MSLPQQKNLAPVSLDIVVVGASISGLATAFALQKAGHKVVVVEQGDGKSVSHGGIRSPPNMTRIFDRFGLAKQLESVTYKCDRVDLLNGATGDTIGGMILTGAFIQDLLAAFVLVQHSDLISLLETACKQNGVTFKYNTKITKFTLDDSTTKLSLDPTTTKYSLDLDRPAGATRVQLDEQFTRLSLDRSATHTPARAPNPSTQIHHTPNARNQTTPTKRPRTPRHTPQGSLHQSQNGQTPHIPPAAVHISSGAPLPCDFVVGADGYDSTLRAIAIPDDASLPARRVVLSFTVPKPAVEKEEVLRRLLDNPTYWGVWLGNRYLMNGCFVGVDGDYSVMITYDIDEPESAEPRKFKGITGWRNLASAAELDVDLSRLEPTARKLLDHAQELFTHITYARPDPTAIICDTGRVALVGDAAHPMMPGALYSSSLALEDAETIGILFSRITSHAHIPRLLSAYEEIRLTRVASTKAYDDSQYTILSLPPGPMADGRNEQIALSLKSPDAGAMDEETFLATWGGEIEIMGFDAKEAAEDWWRQFGASFVQDKKGEAPVEVAVLIADHPVTRTRGYGAELREDSDSDYSDSEYDDDGIEMMNGSRGAW